MGATLLKILKFVKLFMLKIINLKTSFLKLLILRVFNLQHFLKSGDIFRDSSCDAMHLHTQYLHWVYLSREENER